MYEELVKAIHNVDEYDSGYAKLMYDAADAIEELAAVKAQITDGRFYVARDGVLYELKNDPRTIRISSPEFIGPPKEGTK